MAKRKSRSSKRRIFVSDSNVTIDVPCYCGGVTIDEAVIGIGNVLRELIGDLVNGKRESAEITLSVMDMTDAEIDALPSY